MVIDRLVLFWQEANSRFCQAKGETGVSREQKLKDLVAAFDNFVELKKNLEEGTKVNDNNYNYNN